MPTVTVGGGGKQPVTLTFDTKTNAALAQQLGGQITAAVKWSINLGNGNDTIDALGSGPLNVSLGTGKNLIHIGGSTFTTGGEAPTVASAANTTITGGTVSVTPTDETVTISGFQHGKDTISLPSITFTDIAAVLADQTHHGGSSTITLANGTKITFTDLAQVNQGDFKL